MSCTIRVPTAIRAVSSYQPSTRKVPSGFRCRLDIYVKFVFFLLGIKPLGQCVVLSVKQYKLLNLLT